MLRACCVVLLCVVVWLCGRAAAQAQGALEPLDHAICRTIEEGSQTGSTSPVPQVVAGQSMERESCVALLADLRKGRGRTAPGIEVEPLAPWGVQLAGNFSKSLALAAFDRARQRYAGLIGGNGPMI